ncbi:hypothetical protein BDZ91DRAFT_768149 [Kalaharituber pfeilii]|nr:hypothetical protein BDZ91DRAFT_768149 [Kalaharituber pfeilii]
MTPLETLNSVLLLLLAIVYLPIYVIVHLVVYILYLPRALHRFLFHPATVLQRRYWAKDAYALVTGATDGAGRGFAEELARRGWNVIVHGRSPEKIHNVINSLKILYPNQVFLPLVIDCTNPNLTTALPAVLKAFKGLDIRVLINNAAQLHPCAEFDELPIKMIDDILRTNAVFPTEITWCLLNLRNITSDDAPAPAGTKEVQESPASPSAPPQGEGSISISVEGDANPAWHHKDTPLRLIITISSVASLYAFDRGLPYCATKGYINTFAAFLRFSLQSKNIEVMNIPTGALDTKMWPGKRDYFMCLTRNDFANRVLNKIGLARIGHGWAWLGWKGLGLGTDEYVAGGSGIWVYFWHQTITFAQGLLPGDIWCAIGNRVVLWLGYTPANSPLLPIHRQ